MVLPEKLTCIAMDAQGNYCAGGTPQGRIYLWEVHFDQVELHSWLLITFRWLLVLCTTPGMVITDR
jgi:hypothetical protein